MIVADLSSQVLLGGGRRHLLPTSETDREERDQRGRRADGKHLIDNWVHDKKQRELHAEYVWNKGQFDQIDPRRTDYLLGENYLIFLITSAELRKWYCTTVSPTSELLAVYIYILFYIYICVC